MTPAQAFEDMISHLPTNEKVARIKEKAKEVAHKYGLVKDIEWTKKSGRDVYRFPNSNNRLSVDTQHGRFEMLNKNKKHLGEVNFDFDFTKKPDTSGGHNLKFK